jgi:tetratricopeptide (TPR) repeat protein
MRYREPVIATLSLQIAVPAVFAAMSGGAPRPSLPNDFQSQTPEQRAAASYSAGVGEVKEADALAAAAGAETDARKHDKAMKRANSDYVRARRDFESATRSAPKLADAWNALGYTQRKLGDYDAALQSYDHALTLRPGFPEALEYRGEAYLALNRVADAKQVYLDLFASNRALSEQFMHAMRTWIDARRKSNGPPDVATLDDLDKWIQERAQIAAQTASLTRAGTAASWH